MAPLTIAQTCLTPEQIPQYVTLMQAVFPEAKERYNAKYLNWLYYENPNGPVIGFDAWDDNRAVAHYVCIPLRACIQSSKPRKILLSLSTPRPIQITKERVFSLSSHHRLMHWQPNKIMMP